MNRVPGLAVILGLSFTAAAQEGPQGGGPPPALVVTAAVERGTVKPEASLVGSVRAQADSLVATDAAGIVREVGARLGDRVKRGDVLAVLRDAELEEELESARTEVRLAEAEREKAKADLARARDLVVKKVAPQEQLDSAVRDAQVWEQRLAKARSAVRLLEDRVARGTVRSPFDGVVVEEHAEVGEWVAKGGAVAKVANTSRVLVRVPVPEQYVVEISAGLKVPVQLDALAGRSFDGTVSAVIPVGDPEARTFPVEVEVANPKGLIKPGMTARVSFQVGEARTGLLLPKDALVPRGSRTLVYAAVGGKAVEVPVEIVGYKGDRVAVLGELPPGAPVIVRGNERVRPGQAIQTAE